MTIQLSVVDISGIDSHALWAAEMSRLYDSFPAGGLLMLPQPGPVGVFLVARTKP